MEKRPFFRAAMAGLGKYRTGGYGRIGVYRVNVQKGLLSPMLYDVTQHRKNAPGGNPPLERDS